MSSFDSALSFVLRWEGGYSNHPADPGGETYRGISRKWHPQWGGWSYLDERDPRPSWNQIYSDLEPLVSSFYHSQYWLPIRGDDLPPKIASTVFDWAVHSGVKTASKALQHLVGAKEDGVIGPKTILAVVDYADTRAALSLVQDRRAFLSKLIARRPALAVFSRGWENRLNSLDQIIA